VVGQANDSGVILRFTAVVPQLELFDPEHLRTGTASQPVRGGAAEPAQTEDNVFVVALQPSLASIYRRISRLALSIGA
jgi:hypothetical protein